jgi:hypothetical protein
MSMKRRHAIAAVALAGVLALTGAVSGCRGKSGDAAGNRPARQPAVVTTPTPAADVNVDLSDVDAMLAELDKQLSEADKTPADED